MQTFDVPCARCDEFRARFESEGFRVHGCAPNPAKPEMCALRFERPSAIAAIASAPDVAAVNLAKAEPPAKPKKSKAASAAAAGPRPLDAALRRLVNIKALNLRSTPSAASPSNVLRALPMGQPVELIGDQQDGWWPTLVPDDGERGFVKALVDEAQGVGTPSLRHPAGAAREALAAEAFKQWARFEFGLGKETVDPFFKMVGEMWKAIGAPHDGRDDIPWSAAAISFMVRAAAASHPGYGAFRFHASHSKYIHDAIVKAGQKGAPFHGHRLFERKPGIGDLVARSREQPISFEQAASSDAFASHTDIVVAVHADSVLAIGGNVSHSVDVTRYAKTDNGHLSDAGGVFALLVNNA